MTAMLGSHLVRELLLLLHEAREIGEGPAQQVHVAQGVRRLIGASLVIIVRDADFGPGRRGNVVEHAGTQSDASLSQLYRAMAERGSTCHPGVRAMAQRLSARTRGGRIVTLGRTQLMRDADWYRDEFVASTLHGCRLDDFIFSARPVGPGQVVSINAMRGWRERPFGADEQVLLELIHEEFARLGPRRPAAPEQGRLSPRERQVLDCLLRGSAEKEIAGELGLGAATVHGYVKRIYAAYGVRSRAQLLARCLRR